MGSLIHSKATAFAGISFRFGHTSDPHPRVSGTETWLRNFWLGCSFCCWVLPSLWLKFRHNWDLQSSPEWGSWLCMKPTLTSCDSLWMDHSGPSMPQKRQICHWSACIPVWNAHYIFVCFILSMFRFTLNQWILWTQIVISQDTSHLGADGTSCSASDEI